jgi:hypothetical protein
VFESFRSKIPPKPNFAPRDPFYRNSPGREEFDRNRNAAVMMGWDCQHDAELLTWIAIRKSRWRQWINLAAGVMAMVSSGAIASVAADYLTSISLKWLAAFGAAISGLISIANNMQPQSDVLQRMSDASRELNVLKTAVDLKLLEPEFVELDTQLSQEHEQHPNQANDESEKMTSKFKAAAVALHTVTKSISDKRAALTREFRSDIDKAIAANRSDYEQGQGNWNS